MKKTLYLTLGALFCTNAYAGEFVYDYSGTANAFYGYSDYNKNEYNHQKHNNTPSSLEVYTSAGYEFDNGDSFMLNIDGQIAGDKKIKDYNQGDWGENIYGVYTSKYGEFSAGQMYNAAYQLAVGAPSVGYFRANNSPITDFLVTPNWQRGKGKTAYRTLNSTYLNTDGDALKLAYLSPEFYGTKFAFSYTPDSYSKSGLLSKQSSYEHRASYVVGLYNSHEFDYFTLESSLGYALNRKNNQEVSAGLSVYRKGWTLGGSYRKSFTSSHDYALNSSKELDFPYFYDGFRRSQAYNIGLGYEIGPFKTALTYFNAKADKTYNEDNIVTLANRYAFNKNVASYLALAYAEYKGEGRNVKSNRGTAVILGLELNI